MEIRDKNGKTPLMLAKNHQHYEIVKLLHEEIKKRSRYQSVQPVIETWYHFPPKLNQSFSLRLVLILNHCFDLGTQSAKDLEKVTAKDHCFYS